MSRGLEKIEEICRTLAFYADRLSHLRGTTDHAHSRPPEAAYLSAGQGYAGITPWYRVVEPIYEELDHHIRRASAADCATVFENDWILAVEPKLHHIRACYEFDKEFDQARAMLDAAEPAAALAKVISDQVFWTLTPELRDMLAGVRHVAIAGSGPLPLTALAIASTLGLRVTSIDRDTAANEIARKVIEISECRDRITTVEGEADEHDAIEACDAVIGTVLLGVCVDNHGAVSKSDLVERILAHTESGVPFAMRDPYGLGRLYYPAAALDSSPSLDVQRFDPESSPDLPYRSSLLLIRAAQPDEDHAHASTAALCS